MGLLRSEQCPIDSTARDVVHSGTPLWAVCVWGCYRFKNTIKAVSTARLLEEAKAKSKTKPKGWQSFGTLTSDT